MLRLVEIAFAVCALGSLVLSLRVTADFRKQIHEVAPKLSSRDTLILVLATALLMTSRFGWLGGLGDAVILGTVWIVGLILSSKLYT